MPAPLSPAAHGPEQAFPRILSVAEIIAEFARAHGQWPSSRYAIDPWTEAMDIAHRRLPNGIRNHYPLAAKVLAQDGIRIRSLRKVYPDDIRTDMPRPRLLPRWPAKEPTLDECVAALRQADAVLKPGGPLTTKHYETFGPAAHCAPLVRDMKPHDGFVAVRRIAFPGRPERAPNRRPKPTSGR